MTTIGPLDRANRSILRDKLFTPGELLRQNQLSTDPEAVKDVSHERQLAMFEHGNEEG